MRAASATFTVTVSPAADRELSIPISVTRGTAEADDYSVSGLTNGNLTFADTESSKTFTISTNTDSDRSDETVDLAFGQLPACRRHRVAGHRSLDHQRHDPRSAQAVAVAAVAVAAEPSQARFPCPSAKRRTP